MTTKTIYISKDFQEFETVTECLEHEEQVDKILLILNSVKMFNDNMEPVKVSLEDCNSNCDILAKFRSQFEHVYYFALYDSSDVTRDDQWQLFRLHGEGINSAINHSDFRIDNYTSGDVIVYDDGYDTFFNMTRAHTTYGKLLAKFDKACTPERIVQFL